MNDKSTVLFVCIHNSARSQMAEAWLNHIHGDMFAAGSAGIEPGTLNPVVVEAMREVDIDISGKATRSVAEVIVAGEEYDYVITVCDETSAERCPVVPGGGERIHWGFEDPSGLAGSHNEKLAGTRVIRDAIRRQINSWVSDARG